MLTTNCTIFIGVIELYPIYYMLKTIEVQMKAYIYNM